MKFLYDKLKGSYWKKILPATSSAPESAPVPIQLRYFKACLVKNIMLKCIWERRFFLQCLAWLCCICKSSLAMSEPPRQRQGEDLCKNVVVLVMPIIHLQFWCHWWCWWAKKIWSHLSIHNYTPLQFSSGDREFESQQCHSLSKQGVGGIAH